MLDATGDILEVSVREVLVDNTEEEDPASDQPTEETGPPEVFHLPDGTKIQLPDGISLQGMDREHAVQVATLLQEYDKAFSKDELDLGYCNLIPHEIRLSNSTPIRLPHRRIPPHQMSEVKVLLQDMMEKGIIQHSSSP